MQSDYSELVERLDRLAPFNGDPMIVIVDTLTEANECIRDAIAAITTLQAELAEARQANDTALAMAMQAGADAERVRVVEYLRDPNAVMDNMTLWVGKTKAGNITSQSMGELGTAAWFARNAATAIESRDWSKP